MKTPHPNLPPEELNKLRQELDLMEKDILEQLFLVEQKKRFLAVSDIDIFLQTYQAQKSSLKILHHYDRDSDELFFLGIEFFLEKEKTIKNNTIVHISITVLLDNFQAIMEERDSIDFFNDKNGRAELFKIILGDEYVLWQASHLEDKLEGKNTQSKRKI